MAIILKCENISKQYRLGNVGTGTLSHDINRWWHKIRGKEDPYLKIGAVNDRSANATQDYVWAIKDINFDVKKGEVLGIIGKNGAGKSTLLKILSRVTSPTTGSVKTKGRIASLLEVGTGFHPELTGKENIYLNGAILGMNKPEIDLKIDEIIEFSGCKMYIDTPVKRYSSGMHVRLAFAVAAFLEPDILVVDEVLAVGDADFQKKAVGKMQDISRTDGRTVVFVSHNMAAIKNLCSRCLVLKNGLISYNGNPEDAINYYLSSDETETTMSLLERNDRIGNGNLLMKLIQFRNSSNELVNSIISGDELTICLKLLSVKPVKFDKLIVSFAIQDKNERTLLLFVSDEMGTDFSFLEEKLEIKLKEPQFNLRGGTYSIRVVITEGTTSVDHFIDAMNNVGIIEVLEADIYNVGKPNRKLDQVFLEGKFVK